jgi:hypothetical protein
VHRECFGSYFLEPVDFLEALDFLESDRNDLCLCHAGFNPAGADSRHVRTHRHAV